MRVGWVLGWAVPADWFLAEARFAWPRARHTVVPAAPDWFARLEKLGELDAVGGYSFGSQLLLGERERVARRWPRAGLLAPIWGFPRELGRGGRVARAQVRALAAWVRRDDRSAREDFYQRAGLGLVLGAVAPVETLLWGLAELERREVASGLPEGWFAAVGAEDPLLDAEALMRLEAGLTVVRGAGHAPGELIAAWAAECERSTPGWHEGAEEAGDSPVAEWGVGEAARSSLGRLRAERR